MKIAILTSENQWFVPYAQTLADKIQVTLFFHHATITEPYDILFILSYHKIIEKKYLKKNKHNIVIHASDLPAGKGWSPMFWQILQGRNSIVFSMFEASNGIDNGAIYMKKTLELTGLELNIRLRKKQAYFIQNMCLEFLNNYEKYKIPTNQNGKESFYPKRSVNDSELDITKSLEASFNLLRIVNNEEYPAFFYKNGKKYILKIYEDES